jgi:hypothetical protein
MNRKPADWGGNVVSFLVVIAVNAMANGLPLGGQTTGEISDKYPSLFTPAGYVFSIWGLIYLGLALFVVWQALPAQRANPRLSAMRIPFVVSCACNAGWIFAWHYDLLWLSMLLMLGLLGSLVHVYRAVRIGPPAPVRERLLLQLPFSLYLSWISVASIANLSALQINHGWDAVWFDAVSWTLIKIAFAGAIAVTVLFRARDTAFMLVTVWALVGIALKHSAIPMLAGASAVVAGLGLLLVASEWLSRTSFRSLFRSKS